MNTEQGEKGVIIVHGLPDSDTHSAFENLGRLRLAMQAACGNTNVFRHRWSHFISPNTSNAWILSALKGQLGKHIADNLDRCFTNSITRHPRIGEWYIVGYSSGGWGIYEWLLNYNVVRTLERYNKRLGGVFTIGAPLRSPGRRLYRGKVVNMKYPNYSQKELARLIDRLSAARCRIVWSSRDELISEDSASIHRYLMDRNPAQAAGLTHIQEFETDKTHRELPLCDKSIDFIVQGIVGAIGGRSI